MNVRVVSLPRVLLLGAALAVAGLAVTASRLALAQQPGIKRTILLRADDPGNAGYEAIMGLAVIAPHTNSGKHLHHGIEVAYVLDGSVTIESPGRAPVTYKAGDAIKNDSGRVHDAFNRGSLPAKILAVYIVQKGKPIAEPAP